MGLIPGQDLHCATRDPVQVICEPTVETAQPFGNDIGRQQRGVHIQRVAVQVVHPTEVVSLVEGHAQPSEVRVVDQPRTVAFVVHQQPITAESEPRRGAGRRLRWVQRGRETRRTSQLQWLLVVHARLPV